jgi:hypothetical protein
MDVPISDRSEFVSISVVPADGVGRTGAERGAALFPELQRTSNRGVVMAKLRVLVLTAAILIGSWGVARADFCIQDGNFNSVVGKGFSLPGKGACKDFTGFLDRVPSIVQGAACGSTDNTHITFSLRQHFPSLTYFYVDTFILARTTLAGQGIRCFHTTGSVGSCNPEQFARIPCGTVPVP